MSPPYAPHSPHEDASPPPTPERAQQQQALLGLLSKGRSPRDAHSRLRDALQAEKQRSGEALRTCRDLERKVLEMSRYLKEAEAREAMAAQVSGEGRRFAARLSSWVKLTPPQAPEPQPIPAPRAW